MNDEIRALVAERPRRSASELVGEVEAIMSRYGVPEPSREGVIQWIDPSRILPPSVHDALFKEPVER